jgi:hypothetical protein
VAETEDEVAAAPEFDVEVDADSQAHLQEVAKDGDEADERQNQD